MAANSGAAFRVPGDTDLQPTDLHDAQNLGGGETKRGTVFELIPAGARPSDRIRPYFEKVRSASSSVVAFVRNDSHFPFYWHYHPEFELTLIINSRGQRLVGDGIADYGPGDLVLLGPNVPHSWRSGPVK